MVRIFKHYIPGSLLVLGSFEWLVLLASIYGGLFVRVGGIDDLPASALQHLPQALVFTVVLTITMVALGLYQKEYFKGIGTIAVRLLVSFVLGFILLSLIFYIYPDVAVWRSAFIIAFGFAFFGLILTRLLFLRLTDLSAFKRRVLILGAGSDAAKIEDLRAKGQIHGVTIIGYVQTSETESDIPEPLRISKINSLLDFANERAVEEIVVALGERRGALPVDELIDCKLAGINVTEFSTFWERKTGKVDLDTLHPSWLIFSDGFVGGRVQSFIKRWFDLAVSLFFLVFTLPMTMLTMLAIRLDSRGSVFYRQERVGLHGRTFMLLKFRSMKVNAEQDGVPRWAAVNDTRVTRIGGLIRKARIDEIPQVLNVLGGEMSFIGPRPERPFFVDASASCPLSR